MKKLFISLVAIAAAVFATSCTNDIEGGIKFNGKTATVGFEVSTPELATRTFGDGKSATDLYYGVYDEFGVLLPEISVINEPAEINIKTTVNLELVTGDTYSIVFWAENEGSAATIDWAGKTMTFDPQTASKEEYDAFYGKIDFTVEGPATLKADLFRPFAQVNIGTADYVKAQNAGMTVKDVMVKVKAFDTLDLFTAEATKSTGYECHEYAYAVAPTEAYPVEGYEYMTMNYVLVNSAKHLVDVEMTYRNTEDKEYNVVYGNVPVQRNYRTNIYGNLLTDQTGVIVEIKPAFEDDAADVDPYIRPWDGTMEQPAIDGNTVYIATAEQLAFFANAINTNATFDNTQTRAEVKYAYANVVLTHDIDLNKLAWTPIGNQPYSAEGQFRGTFDGQGHTIKGLKVKQAKYAGLFATAHNSLTVKDLVIDGFELEGNHYAGAILAWGEGGVNITNCVVKNGKVTVEPEEVDGKMDNGDKAGGLAGYIYKGVVKGCSVEDVTVKAYRDLGGLVGCAQTAGTYEKNVVKNVEVIADQTVEYGSVKAPNAGEFVGRAFDGIDLSTNYTENVEVEVLVNNNSIAGALKQNVKNIEVTLAENVDLPISSLGQITGGSGEYKLGGVDTETITIDLNGKTLNITTTYWSNLGAKNENALFTIKNGKMTSSQATGTWNSYDLTFSNCDYAFEDVVFEKAVAFDNAGKKVSMKNVTINETHDYYAMWITATGQTVNVEGLTINSLGRGIKIDEQYVGTPAKVTLNVKDSKIKSAKKAAIVVKSVAGAEINVEDLDITEAAADTKFAVWVDEDAAAYAEKVVVNGAYCKVEGSADAVASTEAELKEALENVGTVYVAEGEYTFPASSIKAGATIVCEEGTVFKGNSKLNINGATVVGATFSNPGGTAADQTINGTFKNCTFTGSNGLRWCYAGETVVFENCVFSGDVYGVHFDGGANDVVFKNCVFSGFNTMGGAITELTLEGCTFKANGRSGYNGINMWGNTKMVNCEFTFDGSVSYEWVDAVGDNKTYEFEGCTVNGAPLTAAQVGDYGTGNTITVK